MGNGEDTAVAYWLMKTEPNVFAFDDFLKHPHHRAGWEGVRNYQARNFMRDQFKMGDLVLIYHSSCPEPGVVGLAKVVREAYPDTTALDPQSPYFDSKSRQGASSRWVMVDLEATDFFSSPVPLRKIREVSELQNMLLIRPGQRLSIQPVTPLEWETICQLGQPLQIAQHPLFRPRALENTP